MRAEGAFSQAVRGYASFAPHQRCVVQPWLGVYTVLYVSRRTLFVVLQRAFGCDSALARAAGLTAPSLVWKRSFDGAASAHAVDVLLVQARPAPVAL